MNKQEVIDYVMSTPHNVNRTILSQSLDEIGSKNYDLVLETSAFRVYDISEENLVLLEGTAKACMEKLQRGEPCYALVKIRENYADEFVYVMDLECPIMQSTGRSVLVTVSVITNVSTNGVPLHTGFSVQISEDSNAFSMFKYFKEK